MTDEKRWRGLRAVASLLDRLDRPTDPTASLGAIQLTPKQRLAQLEEEHRALRLKLKQTLQLIAHRRKLVQQVVEDVLSGRYKPPTLYQNPSAEESWVRWVKKYFAVLRRKLHFPKYKEYVTRFDRSQRASFDKGVPILLFPHQIKGMVADPSALPPRTGGRPSSPTVAKRTKIILKGRRAGKSDLKICKDLDALPATEPDPLLIRWRKTNPGILLKWTDCYRHHDQRYRDRIHRIFSETVRKARNRA